MLVSRVRVCVRVAHSLSDAVRQIMYLDAFHLKLGSRELQNDHIMSCVNYLRRHRVYHSATLVYIPENAPGSRGSEVAYLMKDVANSITMAEFGQSRQPGVPKDPAKTRVMMGRTRNALMDGSLAFAHDMATHRDGTVAAMKHTLCQQMLAYHFDELTGKLTGKGEGRRDDLLVSFMMVFYWEETFRTDSRYALFRQKTQQYQFLVAGV